MYLDPHTVPKDLKKGIKKLADLLMMDLQDLCPDPDPLLLPVTRDLDQDGVANPHLA